MGTYRHYFLDARHCVVDSRAIIYETDDDARRQHALLPMNSWLRPRTPPLKYGRAARGVRGEQALAGLTPPENSAAAEARGKAHARCDSPPQQKKMSSDRGDSAHIPRQKGPARPGRVANSDPPRPSQPGVTFPPPAALICTGARCGCYAAVVSGDGPGCSRGTCRSWSQIAMLAFRRCAARVSACRLAASSSLQWLYWPAIT